MIPERAIDRIAIAMPNRYDAAASTYGEREAEKFLDAGEEVQFRTRLRVLHAMQRHSPHRPRLLSVMMAPR